MRSRHRHMSVHGSGPELARRRCTKCDAPVRARHGCRDPHCALPPRPRHPDERSASESISLAHGMAPRPTGHAGRRGLTAGNRERRGKWAHPLDSVHAGSSVVAARSAWVKAAGEDGSCRGCPTHTRPSSIPIHPSILIAGRDENHPPSVLPPCTSLSRNLCNPSFSPLPRPSPLGHRRRRPPLAAPTAYMSRTPLALDACTAANRQDGRESTRWPRGWWWRLQRWRRWRRGPRAARR